MEIERGETRIADPPLGSAAVQHPAVGATLPAQHEISAPRTLGMLPLVTFAAACGLLLVASADTAAVEGATWADPLFWAGLALIVLPSVTRQASAVPSRTERIGLTALVGAALYLVKVWHSPHYFTLHDEFMHWRTAQDIAASGHLFAPNPLLPVSARYPGLEIVTQAVASVSGLSIYAAGLLVVGVARLLFVLGAYLVFERITGSQRIAGIGSALAMCYPNFLFFSAQFSYESLALPLTVAIILAALSTREGRARVPTALIVAALSIGALVVTHHLTSILFAAFLALCALIITLRPRFLDAIAVRLSQIARRAVRLGPQDIATVGRERRPEGRALFVVLFLLTALATGVWMLSVGQLVIDYLAPHVESTIHGAVQVFDKPQGARALFQAPNPKTAAPPWERLVAFISVGGMLLGLLLGLVAWLTILPDLLRRTPRQTLYLALAFEALGYPLILALRLVPAGAEISNRLLDFLSLCLGLTLATGVVLLWLGDSTGVLRRLLFTGWFAVLFAGAVVIGTPQWARLPGSYLVGGDTRSIQPESLDAAHWMYRYLGADNRLIADNTNGLLMGSYGQQDPAYGLSWVYFNPRLSHRALNDLRIRDIAYVVVDRRLSQDLPVSGYYFEGGEPQAGEHRSPLPPKRLKKFDHSIAFERVFDSGDIRIYRTSLGPASSSR